MADNHNDETGLDLGQNKSWIQKIVNGVLNMAGRIGERRFQKRKAKSAPKGHADQGQQPQTTQSPPPQSPPTHSGLAEAAKAVSRNASEEGEDASTNNDAETSQTANDESQADEKKKANRAKVVSTVGKAGISLFLIGAVAWCTNRSVNEGEKTPQEEAQEAVEKSLERREKLSDKINAQRAKVAKKNPVEADIVRSLQDKYEAIEGTAGYKGDDRAPKIIAKMSAQVDMGAEFVQVACADADLMKSHGSYFKDKRTGACREDRVAQRGLTILAANNILVDETTPARDFNQIVKPNGDMTTTAHYILCADESRKDAVQNYLNVRYRCDGMTLKR